MLKADGKQLKNYIKQLKSFNDKNNVSDIIGKKITTQLLNLSINNTPTGKVPNWISDKTYNKYWANYREGELRRAWTFSIDDTSDGNFKARVFNPMSYAKYVEYGHRQDVGRYVGSIERRLVNSWVDGTFMMSNAENEIEQKKDTFIKNQLDIICKKLEG